MNKSFFGILLGLVLGAAATWLVLRQPDHASSTEAAPTPSKSAEAENPLHVSPARRAAAGITLAKPLETNLASEIPAFGRVLDTTPLVTLVAEMKTAQANAAASEKEDERAKKLFASGGNASAQTVETADAAAARDRAAVGSAKARLLATWGRDLVQDLEAIGHALENGAALARLDVLPGEARLIASPKTAQITFVSGEERFTAEVLGASPIADPQVQGASFLVLIRDRALPVGAALRATIPRGGEPVKGLVVPRSAIVYHQGSAWAFVLGEEDTFERKLVTLGRALDDDRVVVTQGLDVDEQCVTAGAQQLLAAELQAGGAPSEE